MNEKLQKAGIKCPTCDYELFVEGELVFCNHCKKRIVPKGETRRVIL